MTLARPRLPRPPRAARAAQVGVWAGAVLPAGCLVAMLLTLGVVGGSRLDWSFLVARPEAAGAEGGIGPILVSTAAVVLLALAVSAVPAAGVAAVIADLTGAPERVRRLAEGTTDLLAAVPSVVLGIFGNAVLVRGLGLGYSLLSGGLTLACVVLPTMTRTIASGLRSLPRELFVAGVVTGLRPTTFVVRIVAPAAKPIILFGFVVGLARGVAETAALLFTSGYVDRMPSSLSDPGRVISVHIYELATNVPQGRPSAYASGLVLVVLLALIGLAAGLLVRAGGRRSAASIAGRTMGGVG